MIFLLDLYLLMNYPIVVRSLRHCVAHYYAISSNALQVAHPAHSFSLSGLFAYSSRCFEVDSSAVQFGMRGQRQS